MNKKTIILLSAIAGIILLFLLLNRDNTSTLNAGDKDFTCKNTDNIDKIFITNTSSKEHVTLTRLAKNDWVLNDKFKASEVQIDILLETMRKLQVKKPVAKEELDNVIKQMIIKGTKVELYENGKILKVFYVGGNTSDDMGTYFYMDKAKEPYICHIPGFNGFLSTRFVTNLNAWRSKNVFKSTEDEIAEIKIDWIEKPGESFVIDCNAKEPVMIVGGKTLKNNSQVNLNKVKSYLKCWENLSYEGFPIDLNPRKIDSIAHTKPLMMMRLTDKAGKSTLLTIHRKGLKEDSYMRTDEQGNPMEFEMENFYAFINDNKTEIVQIQDYVFGKVMKQASEFLLEK